MIRRLIKNRFLVVALAICSMILGSVAFADANGNAHLMGARNSAVHNQSGTSNLVYHTNGTIITGTPNVYLIYWGAESSSDVSLMQRFMNDAGGTSYYNILTQYSMTGGAHSVNALTLAGTWTDSSTATGTVTDAQVQGEVTKAMQATGWTAGPNNIFFVFTVQGTNICSGSSCSFTQFCGYHSHYSSPSGTAYYAAMPYEGTNLSACGVSQSPNGNINADSEINVTSHELFETVNDALGNAWYDSRGNEIGDKCAWNFGTVGSNGANVTLHNNQYIVQQEWSNANSGCRLSY